MNFIILANSKTDYLHSLTQTSIESIRCTAKTGYATFDEIKLAIVESYAAADLYLKTDLHVVYDINSTGGFNYNHALNIGVEKCREAFGESDWWCFANNDVIYDKDWLIAIKNALDQYPELGAISPNCRFKTRGVDIGYVLQKNLDGCCFLMRGSVLRAFGKFDERFSFFFQDDDIIEQLKLMNISCGRVCDSKIFHICSATALPTAQVLIYGRNKFIEKYSANTYMLNELAKYKFWKQCGEI